MPFRSPAAEAANAAPARDQIARDQVAAVQRWRAVIDTQMHFNEMLMRTRATAVSIVSAVFGVAGVSLAQNPERFVTLFGVKTHVASLVVLPGLLLLANIFVLDYFYFYRMLLAVVCRAEEMELESRRAGEPIELELTTCISRHISRRRASAVLLLFYGLPGVAGLLFLIYLFTLGAR